MHHNLLRAAPLAALALLVACNDEPEVVGGYDDPDAPTNEELAEAARELPPMESGQGIFRCEDNSVVYVTFYVGDTQVAVSTSSEGPKTYLPNAALAAAAEGDNATEPGNAAEPEPAGGPVRFTDGTATVVGNASPIQYGTGGALQECHT
ncbi:MAG: hypothetical protein H7X93_11775 [Sphingomonadaceae bacterium]|nr:hypothetical protein [Sphingomonadaceae bacterium]